MGITKVRMYRHSVRLNDTQRPYKCKVLIFRVIEAGFLWKEETERRAKMVIRSLWYQLLLVLVTWLMPAEESSFVGGSLPTMHY